MLESTRGTRNRYSEPSPGTDDDFLAAILVRMWALASGRPLPRSVRPEQLSTEELIAFWADDLSPAAGRHAAGVPSYDVGRLMTQISLGPAGGQVRAMLAFGILGSFPPDRDEEGPGHLHKALDEIVWEALEGSGLPWDRCHREDRGDGALVVLPPGSAADGVIDPLPERLRRLIRLHNRMSGPAAQMQVRAAAHIGPVYRGDQGLAGDGIDQLFRMMHARPLQTALAGSGAELALAVSRSMRHSVVRRRPALAGLRPFRPIDTHVKGTRVSAWMYLPGVPPSLQAGVTGRRYRPALRAGCLPGKHRLLLLEGVAPGRTGVRRDVPAISSRIGGKHRCGCTLLGLGLSTLMDQRTVKGMKHPWRRKYRPCSSTTSMAVRLTVRSASGSTARITRST